MVKAFFFLSSKEIFCVTLCLELCLEVGWATYFHSLCNQAAFTTAFVLDTGGSTEKWLFLRNGKTYMLANTMK